MSPVRTTGRSRALFARAEASLLGGVSSPVRAFRAVGGSPPVITRARGATVEDADGNLYLDFVGSWGPLILGHAHPAVVDAVARAAADGTTFGATCEREILLAEAVRRRAPHVERVRFVSSGTEATMSAIRLARGFTGRELVVKFDGCYHGHADHLHVAAGSGLATFGSPSSAGVPRAFAERTLVLPLDDDEAAELLGLAPDLATYGKVLGGGLPVGAFGGRADVMQRLAPLGDVYQAGTLSGNPVAMAAGLATLEVLEREDGWARLEALGRALEERAAPILDAAAARFVRTGSIFWLALAAGPPPRRADALDPGSAARYAPLFHGLLARGIALAPSAFEVGFLSLAHTEADLDRLAAALSELLPPAGP